MTGTGMAMTLKVPAMAAECDGDSDGNSDGESDGDSDVVPMEITFMDMEDNQ